MAKNKTVFLACMMAVAMVFSLGCKKQKEFKTLSAAGDAYLSEYVTPATGAGLNMGIGDLFTLLSDADDANDPYIIDWRSAEDYAAGHLKGAVNMALSDLDTEIDSLPTDKLIVNVCYTGQNASFATAVINLVGQDPDYAGLEAVNLKFGMCSVTDNTSILPKTDKWTAAVAADEFNLDTTIETATETYSFPSPATGEKTIAAIIKANLDEAATEWSIPAADVFADTDSFFIVNYWPAAEYADPGHIPGAYQFTPKTSLLSDASLNQLPTDQTIVVYCYTGQTSAQVTAYLRLLGYDAKSLLFGVNGFAFDAMPDTMTKYHAPTQDYSSIIE
jgi:rhodanese-related sulfurtransferase